MKIVEVIPLSRGVLKDKLTYFSATDHQPGAIVNITVKNRRLNALVIDSRTAGDLKSDLKKAEYSLKKINNTKARQLFLPQFLTAAKKVADFYAAPFGPTIAAMTPSAALDLAETPRPASQASQQEKNKHLAINKMTLQESDEARKDYYKSLIREKFAKNTSVFICLPTIDAVERMMTDLERGIGDYAFAFHGLMKKKELVKSWTTALATEHPILIVATPQFMCFPRPDIQTIIVDQHSHGAYHTLNRPYLDYRLVAEYLCEEYRATCILGDTYLQVETIYRTKNGIFHPAKPIKLRTESKARAFILKGKSSEPITKEISDFLNECVLKKESVLILANRRGLAPIVVCDDCGRAVECARCETPLTLHQSRDQWGNQTNILTCHRCGKNRDSKEKCLHCDSWRLRELGTGIEKVISTLAEKMPDQHIWRLDGDSSSGVRQTQKIVEKFENHPGGIMVGTEKALHYLQAKIDNIIVMAIDGLLILPDFRINERLFYLLIRAKSLASKHFIIQTRYPKEEVFELARRGNTGEFYDQELRNREEFAYPPFKLLIKISRQGKKEVIQKEMLALKKYLQKYKPAVYPSFISSENHYRLNLLLKLDPDTWPEQELCQMLKSLPPSFIVNVNPRNIL